jgi:hypothetical protein
METSEPASCFRRRTGAWTVDSDMPPLDEPRDRWPGTRDCRNRRRKRLRADRRVGLLTIVHLDGAGIDGRRARSGGNALVSGGRRRLMPRWRARRSTLIVARALGAAPEPSPAAARPTRTVIKTATSSVEPGSTQVGPPSLIAGHQSLRPGSAFLRRSLNDAARSFRRASKNASALLILHSAGSRGTHWLVRMDLSISLK